MTKKHMRLSVSGNEFLKQLDQFALGSNMEIGDIQDSPHVIKAPLFSGRTIKSKVANTITTIPLRLIRKSTMDYYTYQKQINYEFRQEIELLHKRIDILTQQDSERQK